MSCIKLFEISDENKFEETCRKSLGIYASRELGIKNQAFVSTIGQDNRKDVYIEYDNLSKIILGQVKFFEKSDSYNPKAIKEKIKKTIGGTFRWKGDIPHKPKEDLLDLEVYRNRKVEMIFFFFSCEINEAEKMKMETKVEEHYRVERNRDIKVKIFDKDLIISIIEENEYDTYVKMFDRKVSESSLGKVIDETVSLETHYANELRRLGYREEQILMYMRNNSFFERYYDNFIVPHHIKELDNIKTQIIDNVFYNFYNSIENGQKRHSDVVNKKISYFEDKFDSFTLEDKVQKGTYGNMSEISENKFDERVEW